MVGHAVMHRPWHDLHGKHAAICVVSSAPDQAQKSREVTKLKGLKTNRMGNFNPIRNRQVASSTLPSAPVFLLLFPDSASISRVRTAYCNNSLAYFTGTARFDPPNPFNIAKFTPITFPLRLKSGPPEPPDVVAAS
jgi:hypothetical protein